MVGRSDSSLRCSGGHASFEPGHGKTLTVTSTSRVDVRERQTPPPAGPPWEQVRDRLGAAATGDELDARQFTLESPLLCVSAAVEQYAATSFLPGRLILEAAADLSSRIHAGFSYRPGSTSVTTGLDEILERAEGGCQDFARLAIGCFRSRDLAARYVSAYLETRPRPGRPRRPGADVSHAWASVFVPDVGWVDVDPTNDQFVNDRYVVTAWGRDYGDISPLKGVIFTEGSGHELEVSVDVIPSPGPNEVEVTVRGGVPGVVNSNAFVPMSGVRPAGSLREQR